jgi:LacI family transcriptional regulator
MGGVDAQSRPVHDFFSCLNATLTCNPFACLIFLPRCAYAMQPGHTSARSGLPRIKNDQAMDTPNHDPDQNVRPTLKTIAALMGLSVTTVSRALKDAPDISEATKRRIRDMATHVGYRPNRAGVRLRTGKTNVIALVRSVEEDMMNHTSQMINAIATALRGTSYHVILLPYFPEEDPMTPIRYVVETGSADGVIINQTRPDDPRVRYLHDRGFPFATHGRTDMGVEHPYFDFDNETFARMMVREMVARGRRRLALVGPPPTQSYAMHLAKGFMQEAARLGVGAHIAEEVTSDSPAALVEAYAAQIFGRPDRPDGVILGSATASMALIAGGESSGLMLGRDFDVGTKDTVRFLRRFRTEILVVREDVAQAGEFLARAVMAAIDRRTEVSGSQFLDVPDSIG